MSYGRHDGPPRHDARLAAVLLLLYPREQGWHLLLTRRQGHLSAHAGQVSFPGGAVELGETSAQAALREAEEELGVATTTWQPIGSLAPIYLFNSNFWVRPWITWAEQRPDFVPNPNEVAELLELSLPQLLSDTNSSYLSIERGGLQFSAPSLDCGGHAVWGATRILLSEFTGALREIERRRHRLRSLDQETP